MVRVKDESGKIADELRAFGLRYPGAHTKSPWPGHLDLAVKDKTFAYVSVAGEPLKVSCKLPHSAESALSLPFTEPTPYGLGKSGWVTAYFPEDGPVPVELLREWIDESYRAQAPKRMSAGVPPLGGATETLETSATAGRSTVKQRATKAEPQPRSTPKRAAAKPATKKRQAARPASTVVKAKAPRVAKAARVGKAPAAPARRPAAKGASASGAAAGGRPPAAARKRASGGKRAAS